MESGEDNSAAAAAAVPEASARKRMGLLLLAAAAAAAALLLRVARVGVLLRLWLLLVGRVYEKEAAGLQWDESMPRAGDDGRGEGIRMGVLPAARTTVGRTAADDGGAVYVGCGRGVCGCCCAEGRCMHQQQHVPLPKSTGGCWRRRRGGENAMPCRLGCGWVRWVWLWSVCGVWVGGKMGLRVLVWKREL